MRGAILQFVQIQNKEMPYISVRIKAQSGITLNNPQADCKA